jgi:hypothetical protein
MAFDRRRAGNTFANSNFGGRTVIIEGFKSGNQVLDPSWCLSLVVGSRPASTANDPSGRFANNYRRC